MRYTHYASHTGEIRSGYLHNIPIVSDITLGVHVLRDFDLYVCMDKLTNTNSFIEKSYFIIPIKYPPRLYYMLKIFSPALVKFHPDLDYPSWKLGMG